MAYFRFGFLVLVALGATACVRGEDQFIVPLDHPADPGARPGAVLVGSGALDPELQTITPKVKPSTKTPPAPSAGGHQHKH